MTLADFRRAAWLTLALLAAAPLAAQETELPPGSFLVLNYHDISDDVRSQPDRYSLDAGKLVREFAWLHDQGYHPVSLEQIVAARERGAPLPTKAVLLSFDDGYRSFYTRVFPLLKLFNYPALLAIVGSWLEVPEGQVIHYDTVDFPRSHFMTWAQIRETSDSGLVEIASHSYDLHHGVLANPQGNKQPATITHIYDPASRTYESDAAHQRRVKEDLERNSRLIEKHLGKRPRILVWPYGRYNEEAVAIAREVGMPYTVTLVDGINGPETPLSHVMRTIIELNPSLEDFAGEARNLVPLDPIHGFYVELDGIYSPDPQEQEQKLSKVLDRIAKARPSRVYMQAFADPNGDGIIDAMYFPNRYLPMRADLFNRAAWQIATRGGARVFAWMPVSAFLAPPAGGRHWDQPSLAGLYQDMAKHASFDGILFGEPDQTPPQAPHADHAFLQRLVAASLVHRSPLKTARIATADTLAALLPAYDHLVLPFALDLADTATPAERLAALSAQLAAIPGATGKTEIAFRGLDRYAAPNPAGFAELMHDLSLSGLRHFGFRPAEFAADSAAAAAIRPYFTLQAFPRTLPRETFRQQANPAAAAP